MMDSAQQERINKLFDSLRDLSPAQRDLRLVSECGDPAVEQEVRSLLDAYDRSANFLEEPVLTRQAGILENHLRRRGELAPGTMVGNYEITEPIGAGGMGIVYRARDTRLGRDVALKFLPPEVAHDPARRARFQAEARALAALNHPNIATIYGIEDDALVMEFVPGNTLEQHIQIRPIPLQEALEIIGQIAAGLEAAHDRGFVHRDLKPANIKITPAGVVKLLDFGLAKATGPGSSPTSAAPFTAVTETGMVLGSAGYMSPEQAVGKTVDKRSDIWAFGVVLYEMLVQSKAFGGATASERLAEVLTKEPDLAQLPSKVRRLVRACLEKDPKRRLRDVGDWSRLLEEEDRAGTSPGPAPGSRLGWGIAAAAVMALAILAIVSFRGPRVYAPEARVDIVIPNDDRSSFALSPDGSRVVFVASYGGASRLWVRPLDSRTAQVLPGTEGATNPFWSPDSRAVGFFADFKLKRIDLAGAKPQVLAPVPSYTPEGTWGSQGVILFAVGLTPLARVSDSGGAVTAATRFAQGQENQLAPRFLPNGRQFLYVVNGSDPSIWLGSLDGAEPRRITSITVGADSAAEYIGPDWLVRVRQGALEAQRFDAARARLSGDPMPLERSVSIDAATFAGRFSSSSAGTIVWRSGGESRTQLLWMDRAGRNEGELGAVSDANLFSPEISREGQRVATMHGPVGSSDIWIQDKLHNERFTFGGSDNRYPIWSPDGSRIVFASNRNGAYDLYVKPADRSAGESLLLRSDELKRPNSWSPDGRFILYWTGQNNGDLFVLPLAGERKPFPFVNTPFSEQQGVFSPDGKWIAYQSDESGRDEIYVRPFPGPGGQVQISSQGGHSPRWRPDSRELYYLNPDFKMVAAKLSLQGSSITAETPVTLFQTNIVKATNRQQYDVADDGRFLILTELPNSSAEPVHLLLNWRPPGSS